MEPLTRTEGEILEEWVRLQTQAITGAIAPASRPAERIIHLTDALALTNLGRVFTMAMEFMPEGPIMVLTPVTIRWPEPAPASP